VDELNRLFTDAVDLYQPANNEELFAVERIAICKLTILRAARLEAGLFLVTLNMALNDDNVTPFVSLDPQLEDARRDQTRNYALAEGFHRMAKSSNGWSLFLRYQSQAERQYRRAVEELERLRRLSPEPADPASADLPPDDSPNEPISPAEPVETAPDPSPAAEPIASAPHAAARPRCACYRRINGEVLHRPLPPAAAPRRIFALPRPKSELGKL
jgi:hypothetical protein